MKGQQGLVAGLVTPLAALGTAPQRKSARLGFSPTFSGFFQAMLSWVIQLSAAKVKYNHPGRELL